MLLVDQLYHANFAIIAIHGFQLYRAIWHNHMLLTNAFHCSPPVNIFQEHSKRDEYDNSKQRNKVYPEEDVRKHGFILSCLISGGEARPGTVHPYASSTGE